MQGLGDDIFCSPTLHISVHMYHSLPPLPSVLLSPTCSLSVVRHVKLCLAAVWPCSPQGAAVC